MACRGTPNGTTLLPPLAAMIVRGKIIGCNGLTIVPQVVMYEPVCSMVTGIFAPNSASTVEKVKPDPGSPASRLRAVFTNADNCLKLGNMEIIRKLCFTSHYNRRLLRNSSYNFTGDSSPVKSR